MEYLVAFPGRLLSALIKVNSRNVLFLCDDNVLIALSYPDSRTHAVLLRLNTIFRSSCSFSVVVASAHIAMIARALRNSENVELALRKKEEILEFSKGELSVRVRIRGAPRVHVPLPSVWYPVRIKQTNQLVRGYKNPGYGVSAYFKDGSVQVEPVGTLQSSEECTERRREVRVRGVELAIIFNAFGSAGLVPRWAGFSDGLLSLRDVVKDAEIIGVIAGVGTRKPAVNFL